MSSSTISEAYFNKARAVAMPLCDFYDKLTKHKLVMKAISENLANLDMEPKVKLSMFIISDLICCYEHLGHNAEDLHGREGLPLLMVESYLLGALKVTYFSYNSETFQGAIEHVGEANKSFKQDFKRGDSEDFFALGELFKVCGLTDFQTEYFTLLYRFFSVIAKADNRISVAEGKWLEKLLTFSNASTDYGLEEFEKKANVTDGAVNGEGSGSSNGSPEDALKELDELIGLSEVKSTVSAIAKFVKIQQERKKNGLKPVAISYHCVFTGNPGTGKTTVARILANIYSSLGVLKKGHLVETDRSGLVAEYVGQTAVKTNKIIDSALDGVLFIDEAYSLVQGVGNDYGQEAISTLLKRMEDDRDRLVVVLAGYSDEMKRFIDSNPGLQSRFNRYVHFADYTVDELKQIFILNAKKNQYKIDDAALAKLTEIITYAVDHKTKNFGNGRYVRNLFETTIQNQAIRLSSQPSVTIEELTTLTPEDLPTPQQI